MRWKHRAGRLLIALVLMMMVGFVPSCGTKNPPQEKLKIGVLATMSGDLAVSGQNAQMAMDMLVQKINGGGGLSVGGSQYQIELVYFDDCNNPETAVAGATRLINNDNVVAVVGPSFSRLAIPVSKVAEQSGIPMITSSSNPLTTQNKTFVFRLSFIDPVQSDVLARLAREQLKAEKAAVLFDITSEYNRGLAEVFKASFEKAGGKVVAYESYTPDENKDFSAQIARIKASGATLLLLPNYQNELVVQAKQLQEAGLKLILLGGDSWGGNEAEPGLDGGYYTALWAQDDPSPENQAFLKEYRKLYQKEPDMSSALYYDGLGLAIQAMESQGGVTPEAIRQGLAAIKQYKGVTGKLTYEGLQDPKRSIPILKVTKGKAIFYKQVDMQ
ncbi:MAG: ABC transporter substrate-binding protein [Solirubrobacterales bacterium]